MSDEHRHAVMEKYFAGRLAEFYSIVRKSQIPVNDYAARCLPYVGSSFRDEGSPRVLFVGKATKGWDDFKEAIDGQWTAADWLSDSESVRSA